MKILTKERAQYIFNQVVRGLRAQGWQRSGHFDSDQEEFLCLYRGPDNRKCAAGQLLPDSMYEPRLEGFSARSYDMKIIFANLGYSPEEIEFIYALQRVHDTTNKTLESNFRSLAVQYNLTFPETDNV